MLVNVYQANYNWIMPEIVYFEAFVLMFKSCPSHQRLHKSTVSAETELAETPLGQG